MWCITKITRSYRRRMYRLLELYEEPYDARRPVVCFDEKSKQLLEAMRKPIPPRPGSRGKYEDEYRRGGTRNIFVAVEPKAGKRIIKVTKTRKKPDFARFICHLVADEYQHVNQIRLVLDNLNTHFESSFYETSQRKRLKSYSTGSILLHAKPCQLAEYG